MSHLSDALKDGALVLAALTGLALLTVGGIVLGIALFGKDFGPFLGIAVLIFTAAAGISYATSRWS